MNSPSSPVGPTAEDVNLINAFTQQMMNLLMTGQIGAIIDAASELSQRLSPAGQQYLAAMTGMGAGVGPAAANLTAMQQLGQARADLKKAELIGMAGQTGIRPPF
jgi:hydroxyethylthiazole kinase-like sugar kinase family protein